MDRDAVVYFGGGSGGKTRTTIGELLPQDSLYELADR
jgi:hypothetical protein